MLEELILILFGFFLGSVAPLMQEWAIRLHRRWTAARWLSRGIWYWPNEGDEVKVSFRQAWRATSMMISYGVTGPELAHPPKWPYFDVQQDVTPDIISLDKHLEAGAYIAYWIRHTYK